MLPNKQQITEEMKICRNKWKWKHNNPKPMGHCKSSAKWKVYSNAGLSQEVRKKSTK